MNYSILIKFINTSKKTDVDNLVYQFYFLYNSKPFIPGILISKITRSYSPGLFHVDIFNYPDLALKRFKPDFYALAIVDIMMPEMDGFELYQHLKKIDPNLKVCFLTASEMYHQEVREVEHYALNEDLFLQKPISNKDIVREIENKINGSRIILNTKQKILKEKKILVSATF